MAGTAAPAAAVEQLHPVLATRCGASPAISSDAPSAVAALPWSRSDRSRRQSSARGARVSRGPHPPCPPGQAASGRPRPAGDPGRQQRGLVGGAQRLRHPRPAGRTRGRRSRPTPPASFDAAVHERAARSTARPSVVDPPDLGQRRGASNTADAGSRRQVVGQHDGVPGRTRPTPRSDQYAGPSDVVVGPGARRRAGTLRGPLGRGEAAVRLCAGPRGKARSDRCARGVRGRVARRPGLARARPRAARPLGRAPRTCGARRPQAAPAAYRGVVGRGHHAVGDRMGTDEHRPGSPRHLLPA